MYKLNSVEYAKVRQYADALVLIFPNTTIRRETFCFTDGNGIGTAVEVEFEIYDPLVEGKTRVLRYNVTDYSSW
jgi:hypothetical protein